MKRVPKRVLIVSSLIDAANDELLDANVARADDANAAWLVAKAWEIVTMEGIAETGVYVRHSIKTEVTA